MKPKKQQIREEIRKTDYSGELQYSEHSEQPHFKASTNLETKDIQVSYNPDYEKTKNPSNTLRDISRHEMAHHGYRELEKRLTFYGCPRTPDFGKRLIFEPVYEVLRNKGFSQSDAKYTENALEDSLLHSDLGKAYNLDGIVDLFEDVAQSQGFTDFYEAHIKLNLWLWGNKRQKKQLGKYFKHNPDIKEAILNFLQRTGLSELSKQEGRGRLRQHLMDEANWPEISEIYAEEFSKLMTPNYALPLLNHSGAGTKGREQETGSEQDDSEGNYFQKKADSEEYKRGRIEEAHQSNKPLPNWMSDSEENLLEARELFYKNLARKLNIKAEAKTNVRAMPIARFGDRDFDPLKDDFRRVRLKPGIEGKLKWIKKRFQIEMPIDVKTSSRGFPSVRQGMLDCSSSMLDSIDGKGIGKKNIIPWGDNSKYHHTVLGWFSYLEYLRQNHLLRQEGIELYLFSDKTTHVTGLRQAINLALNPVFGNSTEIEPEVAENLFRGEDNLIFTISDGEIWNWDEISDYFIQGAKRNHFFHMQIGSDSRATKDMKKNGLYVVPIMKGEDISRTTIDLTKKIRFENQTS